jgi:hypothetical protein
MLHAKTDAGNTTFTRATNKTVCKLEAPETEVHA